MTILQHPSALELSGNLTKFLISTSTQFTFVLKKGLETILEQYYNPGSTGQVEIDIRDIIEAHLTYTLQDVGQIYEQAGITADFSAVIGSETVEFKVLRGGIDRFTDNASNFLRSNFLTWQPQRKKITYYSPESLTYYAQDACVVHLEAHYSDSTVESIELGSLSAGKAYTIPVQYALVNGLLTKKLPGYYDVYVSSPSGVRYSYVQRYVVSNKSSEDEQWVLFENSLGGCDTFRASGQSELSAEHTHNIAEVDDVAEEFRVDTERVFKKNTGYLDNYERRWLLDFFPSRKKYIYEDFAIRPIVVVESDVSYVSKELPSAYNFSYKHATSKPLLNLSRFETIPTEIVVYTPDSESFTLPLRLIDLPHITPTEGALLLIQNPYSDQVGVVSLQSLQVSCQPRFESEQEDGDHIVLETNAQGEAFGRMPWRIVE